MEKGLMLKVPWRIMAGEEIRLGDIEIKRSSDGDLEACDRYGCVSARVPPERPVHAVPIPAIYRVLSATPYIYVDFDKRILIEEGEDYWTLAPIEIEVYAGELALVRLAPSRVKHTLIGDVVEGTLARYYKASAVFDEEDLEYQEGTAIVRFIVRGSSVLLPGVGFNASGADFYVDDEGRLYYPQLEVAVQGNVAVTRRFEVPPKKGLRPVRFEPYRMRRVHIPVGFAYTLPFTMKVDVVKRYLPQP
ncbi:MAG: DUF432 domain-containing protein [Desulfurococcales archaeon]|nr:DUF432 domain-containing protein [Desulfurococcales archaeon]